MDKNYDHLENYLRASGSYDSFSDDLAQLADSDFIVYDKTIPHTYKSIVVQDDVFARLWKDDIFDELLRAFPTKVQRPDGTWGYLKKDKRLCEDLYYIITKDSRMKHDHIMKCLSYELSFREKTGAMKWMKVLQNWLSGREWENFEDLVADESYNSQTPMNTYGTKLI